MSAAGGNTQSMRCLVCQNCNAQETLDKKLLNCGRCRASHYCSVECQRAHWPEHKARCKARVESDTRLAEAHGEEFMPHQTAWVHLVRPWLTQLVHLCLGEARLKTHVLLVTTDYHPNKEIKFTIARWEAMPIAGLEGNRTLYEGITQQLEVAKVKEAAMKADRGMKSLVGIALIRVEQIESAVRLIPVGVEYPNSFTFTDRQLVEIVNQGVYNQVKEALGTKGKKKGRR